MTVLYPMSSVVTFVANGENQIFQLECDSTIDMIENCIIEYFNDDYRPESICVNGHNVMYPNIKSGYLVVDGKMADMLIAEGKTTYYSLKNMDNIMKLGVRKGDTLHLKGISSFKVNEVDYGDRCLCIELV
jgi:hypothetical protein